MRRESDPRCHAWDRHLAHSRGVGFRVKIRQKKWPGEWWDPDRARRDHCEVREPGGSVRFPPDYPHEADAFSVSAESARTLIEDSQRPSAPNRGLFTPAGSSDRDRQRPPGDSAAPDRGPRAGSGIPQSRTPDGTAGRKRPHCQAACRIRGNGSCPSATLPASAFSARASRMMRPREQPAPRKHPTSALPWVVWAGRPESRATRGPPPLPLRVPP
jgi:hypothetical protein